MKDLQYEKYVMLTIVISFISGFLTQLLSISIYPPDFSGEFPVYLEEGVMLLQLSGALVIIGFTVIDMKAEEEKQMLAAAGFTAQAISFGISILSIFDITEIVSFDQYIDFYRISVSSNFLLFPSLLLIATYNRFKKWIRIYGIIAGIPLIISTFMFLFGVRDFHLLEIISNIGYGMFLFVYLLWVWNIYSNYRKEMELLES